MKLFLSTLMASIAFTQARNLQIGSDLETRWALENPVTQYVAAENKFTLTYNDASSANLDVNLRAAFFDGNCKDPVPLEVGGIAPTAFSITVGNGITAVLTEAMPEPVMNALDPSKPELEFKVDTLKLANTPEIYEVVDQALIDSPLKPYSADDMGKGVMTMCARFSLGYVDVSGNEYQEVNFIESVITIKYDLTAGFSVDAFAVEAKDKDAATGVKDSYQVIAYLCDASTVSTLVPDGGPGGLTLENVPAKITSYEPLNGLPDPAKSAFQQGALVTVCVTPDALTIADGIVMGAITDFTWKRDSTGTTQPAVEETAGGDFVAASNGLSALSCVPQSVYCSFASILFADFYLSAGTVAGDGNANMEFKITRRRLKGGVEGERRQLQEAAAASPFDVSVGVTELDDGPGALKTAGGASTGFTALASAVALVSLALLA